MVSLSHLGTIKLMDHLSEDYDPVIEWCDGLSDYFKVSSIKFVHVLWFLKIITVAHVVNCDKYYLMDVDDEDNELDNDVSSRESTPELLRPSLESYF